MPSWRDLDITDENGFRREVEVSEHDLSLLRQLGDQGCVHDFLNNGIDPDILKQEKEQA